MIKSILVAMDGSPASMAGLRAAAKWAALLRAELRGMFVEDEQRFVYFPAGFSAEGGIPVSAPLPEQEMQAEIETLQSEAREIRQAFDAACREHSLENEFIQVRGNVNALLTRQAHAADLVVMGCRGINEPTESHDPGPTTETLIHSAQRPVMVVPEKPRMDGGILFAYDGGRGVNRVLTHGTELALASDNPISVVSVGTDPAYQVDQEEILRHYWQAYNLEPNCRVVSRNGRVSDTILDIARKEEMGLIVMGAFGHHPLHELFFGSTTLDTMGRAPCPVLLMA